MPAAEFPIVIERGVTFTTVFQYTKGNTSTPVDLTGYTGYMQIRDAPSGNLIYTVPSTDIFIDVPTGKVQISIPMSGTASMRPGEWFYDIVLKNGGYSRRFVEGKAVVSDHVTTSHIS